MKVERQIMSNSKSSPKDIKPKNNPKNSAKGHTFFSKLKHSNKFRPNKNNKEIQEIQENQENQEIGEEKKEANILINSEPQSKFNAIDTQDLFYSNQSALYKSMVDTFIENMESGFVHISPINHSEAEKSAFEV